LIPVRFSWTRATAFSRSELFKNHAFDGVSGSRKMLQIDQATVAPPRIRNDAYIFIVLVVDFSLMNTATIHTFHGAIVSICPIP
jgi:hypothetical protein